MSDFEQWYVREFGVSPGFYQQKTDSGNGESFYRYQGWQAAIASMQGEAVGMVEVGYSMKHECYLDDGDDNFFSPLVDANKIPAGTKLFTYPPSAASKIAEQEARIKELEQQLSATWIPMSQQRPIEEHGYKVLGFGDGYVFECEYECRDGEGNWCNITGETMTHWMPLPPNPDAAIRQIGGAE